MTSEIETGYGANDIVALQGLEAVRKRPGMYIGSTDSRGILHLAHEIIDNSVDEAVAGHCTRIEVILRADDSIEVIDNGRGIPTGHNTKSNLDSLVVALSVLHAGGKFSSKAYASSGGLHGVGSAVTNALSLRLDAVVKRAGKVHEVSFEHGVPGTFSAPGPKAVFTKSTDVRVTGKCPVSQTGTSIRWWVDRAYFVQGADLVTESLHSKLRNTAFLVPGLTIALRDERTADVHAEEFCFPGGVVDMVNFNAPAGDKAVCAPLLITGEGTYKENAADENGVMQTGVERRMEVEIAFRWGTGYETAMSCFTNVIPNANGGTHRKGFERAVAKALVESIKNTRGLLKPKEDAPILDDVLEGMTAVVHVRVPEPQFTSQTKDELSTAGVPKVVQGLVEAHVKAWVEGRTTKNDARVVLNKVVAAARTRLTQKSQKDAARRKTALEGASMPPKLLDCRSTGVDRSEIYIVEGDSALGCFSGETTVQVASGGTRTFAELAVDWENGVTHFGYSTDTDGDIVIVPLVAPRLTKRDTALVRVTFDDGSSVRCTPDHKFRLRDGSYHHAEDLTTGASLMPLYTQLSDKKVGDRITGYEQVWMNASQKWAFTHRLADQWNLDNGFDTRDDGDVRHHKDVNKRNNDPRNLKRMTHRGHWALHASMMGPHIRNGYLQWAKSEEGAAFKSAMLSKQWREPAFREACLLRLTERNQDPEFREKIEAGFQDWYAALNDEELAAYAENMRSMQAEYWAHPEHRAAAAARALAFFEDPARRAEWSAVGTAVWQDEDLLKWRSEKTIEQFSDPAERERQRMAVLAWHQENPEFGVEHSARMKARLTDPFTGHLDKIQAGRRKWVEESPRAERVGRLIGGRQTAALKRLATLGDVPVSELRAAYEAHRLQNAKTGLKFDRLMDFYANDISALRDAATRVNHSVVSVEHLTETADVYDLTVETHHNFALGCGVFVHNSCEMARVSEYQALFPIRGKILNVMKADMPTAMRHAEVEAIIQIIGAGSGRTFDLDAMRYGRVIIMADADVDGSHIRCLLIALFARYMRPVVEAGRLYTAMPPLHGITTKGRNPETIYTFTAEEMESEMARLAKAGKQVAKVQRYKGLGEMNHQDLWDTTMNPQTRTMRRITMNDVAAADTTLELLLGDKVEPRKQWIIETGNLVDREAIDA